MADAGTAVSGWMAMAALGKMLLVLAVIIILAIVALRLMRRAGFRPSAGGRAIHVVDSRALGSHDKVVVVSVGGKWLVLGVGRGGIRRLGEMPAVQQMAETHGDSSAPTFQSILTRLVRGRGDR